MQRCDYAKKYGKQLVNMIARYVFTESWTLMWKHFKVRKERCIVRVLVWVCENFKNVYKLLRTGCRTVLYSEKTSIVAHRCRSRLVLFTSRREHLFTPLKRFSSTSNGSVSLLFIYITVVVDIVHYPFYIVCMLDIFFK